jgi:hypothetical protein
MILKKIQGASGRRQTRVEYNFCGFLTSSIRSYLGEYWPREEWGT